jgi:uncharacterized DUF497 family protein
MLGILNQLMPIQVEGFDWDAYNEKKISEKHGLSREEIEAVFRGRVFVGPDLKHSGAEERHIAIGRGPDGQMLFVGFTFRVHERKLYLRPITARRMHAREIARHEEEIAKNEE